MAGIADKIMRRTRSQESNASNWTNTGTFINKPPRGWIHPDDQLSPDNGVCYGVRYIGCMEVKQSMKSLDFETRTAVAKESISRVCDAAGLKTASKKNKRQKIAKYLGDEPNLVFAGSNVNLTITTDSLTMMIMESGEVIANHQMPGISFASGGDPDTLDFVAYVAKDPVNGRACFVLECGGGLAQDVITTMGQAFELRFKQFLDTQPQTVSLPDRLDNGIMGTDSWGDEGEYYNDRPGAAPPETEKIPEYPSKASPPAMEGDYQPIREKNSVAVGNLIDLDGGPVQNDLADSKGAAGGSRHVYENPNQKGSADATHDPRFDDAIYDNKQNGAAQANGQLDAFDMKPFSSALPNKAVGGARPKEKSVEPTRPDHEEWFHGPLTRHQTETLLHEDGDFLVRESANSPGQYVLSGVHKGRIRHLLLVDPQGVVRTRDRTFTSVSHLVHYHLENGIPIVSQESELVLKNPIVHAPC